MGGGEQLAEFVPDPLGRHYLEPTRHLGHGLQGGRGGLELQRRPETKEPKHPQRIVGEGLLRGGGGGEDPQGKIGKSSERIDHLGVGHLDRQGVHRKVPPLEVIFDGVGERDLRMAAVGAIHVPPEGGYLEGPSLLHTGHCPEGLARGVDLIGPAFKDGFYLRRTGVGGEVVFAAGARAVLGQEGITHRASHQI